MGKNDRNHWMFSPWGNLWIFEIPFFLWESWESWWSLGKQPSCQVGTSTNTFRCIAQCRSAGSAALHCREHHLLHRAQRAKYTQLQPLQERMDGIDGIESKQSKCDEHWWFVPRFLIQLRFNYDSTTIQLDKHRQHNGVLENSRWKCWVAEKKNGRNSWWKQIGVAVVSPRINPQNRRKIRKWVASTSINIINLPWMVGSSLALAHSQNCQDGYPFPGWFRTLCTRDLVIFQGRVSKLHSLR